MTKSNFMNELQTRLSGLPQQDLEERLSRLLNHNRTNTKNRLSQKRKKRSASACFFRQVKTSVQI